MVIRTKNAAGEKSLNFQNPSGKVRISLSAVENFIKKIAAQIPGIHEIKPKAAVGKNKLILENRVTVWGNENLLTITGKAQDTIKNYLLEILGGEEKVEVNMHIVKVLQDASKLTKEIAEETAE